LSKLTIISGIKILHKQISLLEFPISKFHANYFNKNNQEIMNNASTLKT